MSFVIKAVESIMLDYEMKNQAPPNYYQLWCLLTKIAEEHHVTNVPTLIHLFYDKEDI